MRKTEEIETPSSCFNRARDNECLFVLLGRDDAAPATVRFWVEERIRLGKNKRDDAQIMDAERWIEEVVAERLSTFEQERVLLERLSMTEEVIKKQRKLIDRPGQ